VSDPPLAHAPALRVVAASKSFGIGTSVRHALRDVSFTVRPGEQVALLGASGSGKSTLLRCLCGLEVLDAVPGRIEVHGKVIQQDGRLARDVRRMRRGIGIIFQQFNLVGRLPVDINVLTGLAAELPLWRALTGHFTLEERARALDALEAVGLQDQAHQRASTLSDEPVASLDPESTRRVMELLVEINRRSGLTLLVSLHHVPLARRYCTRVLALREGALVFDGPTSALSPAFLRELYGSSADELIDA
jgi:phosphonate transport system ATP-binding protein